MHKLNTASDLRPPPTAAKPFDFGERRTFAVDPPSEREHSDIPSVARLTTRQFYLACKHSCLRSKHQMLF